MAEIRVDTSEVGGAALRKRILASVRDSGYQVKPHSFWPAFRSAEAARLPQGMLVVCDLAKIASAFRQSDVHRWVSAVRRARPVFLALVRTQRDERHAALIDDLVRHSDSRFWACRATPGKAGFERCLCAALDARDPGSLVDVRYLSMQDQLRVEFGDGLSGLLRWQQLGIADLVQTLSPESATIGAGGQSVELLTKDDALFEIDAASIRAVLDAQFARTLRHQAAESDASVGARLRGQRDSAGLTQIELSERTGIDQAVISRLERGKHRPRLDTLQKIAAALGISVAELLAA